ncbi:unnamed protein product [Echinostoma caproni]|uniref:Ras-associating domain-containing protein n=1 Tax=Echinostoma caproni TaxID=27848 RepID=A0A183A555_9TREM|nr:unnamed protein product [Echinostoma caproni]
MGNLMHDSLGTLPGTQILNCFKRSTNFLVTVYGEHFEQGEPFQSYTVGSKETAKELIQQILRRNHLNLKDPNLFYLTFHIDPRYISTNYELMAVPRFTHGSSDRSGGKSHVGTLYSDAILSRTLDLTKDNRSASDR